MLLKNTASDNTVIVGNDADAFLKTHSFSCTIMLEMLGCLAEKQPVGLSGQQLSAAAFVSSWCHIIYQPCHPDDKVSLSTTSLVVR